MKTTLLAITLLAAASIARADDNQAPTSQPPDKWQYTLFSPTPSDLLRGMDTDRPNKTNTPHTIDAGHIQIETGFFDYAFYRDKYQGANSRAETLDLGQFNFRLGVLNNLELNIVVNALDFQRTTDYTADQSIRQNGFGDNVVGGKLNFWGNESGDDIWATSLGIQPQFKIPTARENIGNGHPEVSVGFPFLMNLPASFHLGLQTTVTDERNTNDTGYVAGWQNSVSLDRVFFDKFDLFCEYWSHVSTQHHLEAQQTIDAGLSYQLNDNVALDTAVNFGLNKASTSIEWLAGVSFRF